jgi:RTX calcium-binding nonapeptide repeat (4 copies)
MRATIVAGAIILLLGMTQAAPTLAAPSCDGHRATIVGTAGDDTITGTAGDDVIVAGRGEDDVWGSSGADIICGGPGDDVLAGARSSDRLLGNGGGDILRGDRGDDRLEGGFGRDLLSGGPDDDRLDGGPGRDACLQGSGSGRLTRCDNAYADLAIVGLSCPSSATLDIPFDCQVQLANHGPKAAHYVIHEPPFPKDCFGSCAILFLAQSTGHTVHHPDAGALLAAGDERTDVIEVTITRWPGDEGAQPSVTVLVRPVDAIDAIDPEASNNMGSTPIERA